MSNETSNVTVRSASNPFYQRLKPAGKREKFTITVTYDTRELYGVVDGSREIEVVAE
mgnify:CR=1 FL=1